MMKFSTTAMGSAEDKEFRKEFAEYAQMITEEKLTNAMDVQGKIFKAAKYTLEMTSEDEIVETIVYKKEK